MATPSVTISTPVPPEAAEKIKRAAKAAHVTTAAWVRNTLIREAIEALRDVPEDEPTLEDIL